jgi:hypothetical protein
VVFSDIDLPGVQFITSIIVDVVTAVKKTQQVLWLLPMLKKETLLVHSGKLEIFASWRKSIHSANVVLALWLKFVLIHAAVLKSLEILLLLWNYPNEPLSLNGRCVNTKRTFVNELKLWNTLDGENERFPTNVFKDDSLLLQEAKFNDLTTVELLLPDKPKLELVIVLTAQINVTDRPERTPFEQSATTELLIQLRPTCLIYVNMSLQQLSGLPGLLAQLNVVMEHNLVK